MSGKLGASLCDNGCDFRVWAPNAEKVCVLLQDGSNWKHGDPTASFCFTKSDDGYWTGFVSDVGAGRLYRYEI
jgi:1,4-alpha-glucan branching enzyme